MADIVLIALVSALGPVLVGVAAALAQIYGPSFRDAKVRRLEREQAEVDVRYERAGEFVGALTDYATAERWADTEGAFRARNRFVATLRSGEWEIEVFTAKALREVRVQDLDHIARLQRVNDIADRLFGYLRGDVPLERMEDDF